MGALIKPLMLIILDGYGLAQPSRGNAITCAEKPVLDMLYRKYSAGVLAASGECVGLPKHQMGNSEVGHMNLGAGRVVYQDLTRIDRLIETGDFFLNPQLQKAMDIAVQNNSTLHLMGLTSNGGVHSSLNHLFAIIDMAKKAGVKKLVIHAFMDGRDTSPVSGVQFIKELSDYLTASKIGVIGTIMGRYYAMDRDKRWDRVEKAYNALTRGQGFSETNPVAAIENAYKRGETDEFIKPLIITTEAKEPLGIIQDHDTVIFFNFRTDRTRELTQALTEEDFIEFLREAEPKIAYFVCFTEYDKEFKLPVAFPPMNLKMILGEYLSNKGISQLRIAETEKYAHVTYFFNSGREEPFPLEERILIPSPREVATYDLKPEMSAYLITEQVLKALERFPFVVLNFANPDMVGHTGNIPATIKAIQIIDECVGKIYHKITGLEGKLLITADHGNAEKLLEADGTMHTAHTTNPVPLLVVDEKKPKRHLKEGRLADLAPTILSLLDMEIPPEMDGTSLIDE